MKPTICPFFTVPEAIEALAVARQRAREGFDTTDVQISAQQFIDDEAERLRKVRTARRDPGRFIVFAMIPACILLAGWIDRVPQ